MAGTKASVYPSWKDFEEMATQVNQAFKRADQEIERLKARVAELETPKKTSSANKS